MKLDIVKYFDNIDHKILYNYLEKIVKDKNILWLINNIIYSYNEEKGVPIGNLTSQYFANIFLTEMDHYIKEKLQLKGYCRYMDDFILFGNSQQELKNKLKLLEQYIYNKLNLQLHIPVFNKVSNGVPFLGFRVYSYKIKLLKKTKLNFRNKLKIYCKKLEENEIDTSEFKQSMFSVLGHVYRANSYKYIESQCKKIGFYASEFFDYAFFAHKCSLWTVWG